MKNSLLLAFLICLFACSSAQAAEEYGVFAVADRIVVMKQGRLVSDDATSATTLNRVIEKSLG